MFVTSTDIAIVERDVSSLFLAMRPMPLRRVAVLKYRSVGIVLGCSLAVFPESICVLYRPAKLRPAYPDPVFITEADVVLGTIYFVHKSLSTTMIYLRTLNNSRK